MNPKYLLPFLPCSLTYVYMYVCIFFFLLQLASSILATLSAYAEYTCLEKEAICTLSRGSLVDITRWKIARWLALHPCQIPCLGFVHIAPAHSILITLRPLGGSGQSSYCFTLLTEPLYPLLLDILALLSHHCQFGTVRINSIRHLYNPFFSCRDSWDPLPWTLTSGIQYLSIAALHLSLAWHIYKE